MTENLTENDLHLLAQMRRWLSDGTARRLRLDHDLKTVEIAGAARVAPGTVGHWEAGLRVPRGAPALRYARILDGLARTDSGALVAS
jgi:DNA-binding transcriptional regulator YiaG